MVDSVTPQNIKSGKLFKTCLKYAGCRTLVIIENKIIKVATISPCLANRNGSMKDKAKSITIFKINDHVLLKTNE